MNRPPLALAYYGVSDVPPRDDPHAKATVFVVAGRLGQPHPDTPSRRILGEPELRRLADSGALEIGARHVREPSGR